MNDTCYDIVITEDALRQLLEFRKKSDRNAHQVQHFVDALRSNGVQSEVIKVSGAQRPLWCHHMNSGYVVYFTIGEGSKQRNEIRLLYFGEELSNNTGAISKLLMLAGEFEFQGLPLENPIEEIANAEEFPPAPAAMLDGLAYGLKTYLNPESEEEIDQLIAADKQPMDDLKWCRYRKLNAWRNPEDLALRLGPQQEAVIHMPRPLLLQGSAGSGKTTILTHIAYEHIQSSHSNTRILVIVYNDALKRYVVSLLEGLSISGEKESRIDVLTWRELCEHLADSISMDHFPWLDEIDRVSLHLKWHRKELGLSKDLSIPELLEIIRAVIKGRTQDIDKPLLSLDESRGFGLANNLLYGNLSRIDAIHEAAEKYQIYLDSNGLIDDMDAARILLSNRERLPRWDIVLIDETQDYTLIQLRLLASLCKSPSGLIFFGDEHQIVYPSHFSWYRVKEAIYASWNDNRPDLVNLDFNYRNPRPVAEIGNTVMSLRSERLSCNECPEVRSNQVLTPQPVRFVMSKNRIQEAIATLAEHVGSLGIIFDGSKDTRKREWSFRGIGFRRAFTPQTAKGLEFDVVCLIRFNNAYKDLVLAGQTRLSASARFLKYNEVYVSLSRTRGQLIIIDPAARQGGLWDDVHFKNYFRMIDKADDLLTNIPSVYHVESLEGWRFAAIDFEHQNAYEPAAECWERAGEFLRAGLCYKAAGKLKLALSLFEKIGEYLHIAKIYEKTEDYKNAALAYEKAGKLDEAGKCYEKENDYKRAAQCWLKVNQPAKAAQCFQRFGEIEEAAFTFEKAGLHREAAECWEEMANSTSTEKARVKSYLLHAAKAWNLSNLLPGLYRQFEELVNTSQIDHIKCHFYWLKSDAWIVNENFDRAIITCEKIQTSKIGELQWEKLAYHLERAGKDEQAAEAWERAGKYLNAAQIYRKINEFHKAALTYERINNQGEAAECFEMANDILHAAQCWLSAGQHNSAARCFLELNMLEDAALAYSESGLHTESASCWEQLAKSTKDIERIKTNLVHAANAWEQSGQLSGFWKLFENKIDDCPPELVFGTYFQLKAETCIDVNKLDLAKETCELITGMIIDDELWKRLNENNQTAELWERLGKSTGKAEYWKKAAEQHIKADNLTRAATALTHGGNHYGSASLWETIAEQIPKNLLIEKVNARKQAAEAWEKAGEYLRAGFCYEVAGDYNNAIVLFNKAKKTLHVAKIYKLLNQYQDAAIIYMQSNYFKEAAECFELINFMDSAAVCWQSANQPASAARCFQKANLLEDAALSYSKAGLYADAAYCWEHLAHQSPAKLEILTHAANALHMSAQLIGFGKLFEDKTNGGCPPKSILDTYYHLQAVSWIDTGDFERAEKTCDHISDSIMAGDVWALLGKSTGKIKYWEKTANMFETANKPLIAAQCWKLSSQSSSAARCYLKIKMFKQAAIEFNKANMYIESAYCWERLAHQSLDNISQLKISLIQAANAWELSKLFPGFGILFEAKIDNCPSELILSAYYRLQAVALINIGNFKRAKEVCSNISDFFMAGEIWELLGKSTGKLRYWQEAATVFEKSNKLVRAAQCWQSVGQHASAAHCFQQADVLEKAARSYNKAGLYIESASCWEHLAHKKSDDIIQIKSYLVYAAKALHLSRELPGFDKFLEAKIDNCPSELILSAYYRLQAVALISIGNFERAKEVCSNISDFFMAGEIWELLGKSTGELRYWQEAATVFEKSNKLARAAQCWQSAGQSASAARCFQEVNMIENAALSYNEARLYTESASCWEHLASQSLPEVTKVKTYLSRAANAWHLSGQLPGFDILIDSIIRNSSPELIMNHYYRSQVVAWIREGRVEQAHKAHEQISDKIIATEAWSYAAIFFEEISNYNKAALCWELDGNFERAEVAQKNYRKGKEQQLFENFFSKPGKIRVYELARILNMRNKELLEKLSEMNIIVRSHMSSLDDEVVNRIKATLLGKDAARIKPTVIRRRRKKPDHITPEKDKLYDFSKLEILKEKYNDSGVDKLPEKNEQSFENSNEPLLEKITKRTRRKKRKKKEMPVKIIQLPKLPQN
ncbi:MAG: AAA family ATPase [Desulfobacterales bacterium]|nr:AAA family ATPase [Desulfobacterales bacterium]